MPSVSRHKYFLLTSLKEGDSYQLPDLKRLVSSLLFPSTLSTCLVSPPIAAGSQGTLVTLPGWKKAEKIAKKHKHSVFWPKEISHFYSNIKGGRADSLLLHLVSFFPAGGESGGWGEMQARKFVKVINSATQETSNERILVFISWSIQSLKEWYSW